MRIVSFEEASFVIQKGGVCVIPTDTVYGIVASAFSEKAVQRVYDVRGRSQTKPCIVLTPDQNILASFGIVLTENMQEVTKRYWPGPPVSIVFPCDDIRLEYLHRGTKTLAFRVPDPRHADLTFFLQKTGPVIAPSANPQGLPPAQTTATAYEYFSDKIDCYVDGGTLSGEPSAVIALDRYGGVSLVRKSDNSEILLISNGVEKTA